MYLLYLDTSGAPKGDEDDYFVLGGVAVFERRIYHLAQDLENIQQTYFPSETEPVEFHASVIRSGKGGPWSSMPFGQRQELMGAVYSTMTQEIPPLLVAFAAAIHKPSLSESEQALPCAFEQVCTRFDYFLARLHREDDTQRGLVIMDTCRVAEKNRFRDLWTDYIAGGGTQWGKFKNLTDIPFFADSDATRMLQLADFCSYAVYRRYQAGDTGYLDQIIGQFDQVDGIIHGLYHFTTDHRNCCCPACLSRRSK